MLVRFEVESSEPIQRVELMLNDGQPPLAATFPVGLGEQDGRYFRALAFKPVINGTWTLTVRAFGAGALTASTTCPGVTVTF